MILVISYMFLFVIIAWKIMSKLDWESNHDKEVMIDNK